MKVVDANLLLYAVNRDSLHHERAREWLESALSGDEPIALPWVSLLAFIRVATSDRVFSRPLSAAQAVAIVDSWLEQPVVVALSAGESHWGVMRRLIEETGTAGNLTTDAHLAALAIENAAELCSADSDFARFPTLRHFNPLAN